MAWQLLALLGAESKLTKGGGGVAVDGPEATLDSSGICHPQEHLWPGGQCGAGGEPPGERPHLQEDGGWW